MEELAQGFLEVYGLALGRIDLGVSIYLEGKAGDEDWPGALTGFLESLIQILGNLLVIYPVDLYAAALCETCSVSCIEI